VARLREFACALEHAARVVGRLAGLVARDFLVDALELREQLAFLHPPAEVDVHRVDDALRPRDHGGIVLDVELARKFDRDALRGGVGQVERCQRRRRTGLSLRHRLAAAIRQETN
jgi:hypothetical protein